MTKNIGIRGMTMENMTILSKTMLERAIRIQSVSQAAKALSDAGNMRTLGDILKFYSHSENPKTMLVDGLMSITPTANRDSVDKKVRNWLSGRTGSVSKQDAFILSRVLDLDLDKTDVFLKQVTGEGIHWRNPEDIVWSYGISHSYTYQQIAQLLERAVRFIEQAKTVKEAIPQGYTAGVKNALEAPFSGSEEDLLDYLAREQDSLGVFHNTAYRLFMQYIKLLENGYSEDDLESTFKEMDKDEKKKAQMRIDGDIGPHKSGRYTTLDILEAYLYRKMIPATKKGEPKNMFTGIQRSIRQNWPDETTISKIKNRELDVSRKVLILLFLATDGSESEYEELDEDEDILTRDKIFKSIYTRLNLMLRSCGFQLLDPRSPFDWMVLYSICADEFWDVDQRLRDILLAMFPDGNENQ